MRRIDFLIKARSAHGYKYQYLSLPNEIKSLDYIQYEYMGEVFTQRVSKHLMGKRAELCLRRKNTLEHFISSAKEYYGDDYDYSLVEYKNQNSKVLIKSNQSGILYSQTPHNHLRYRPENQRQSTLKTKDEFVIESKSIHGEYYNYDKFEYRSNKIKSTIICKEHGEFQMTAMAHLKGNGCASCKINGFTRIEDYVNSLGLSCYRTHYFVDEMVENMPFGLFIPSKGLVIDMYHTPPDFIEQKRAYCDEYYYEYLILKPNAILSQYRNYFI